MSRAAAPEALTTEERRLVGIIWGTYALYYLGRVNFSPALPALAIALGVSRAEIGLLGTVFFWMYALGQLVNGELGNHLSPRRMVALGLAVIAAVNLLFAAQTSLILMALLWGLNGFAQATGWGPMLRILSDRLRAAQRRRVSTLFAMSFQAGSALTWALAGVLVVIWGWQAAFIVPGLVLIGVLIAWQRAGIDANRQRATPGEGLRWHEIRADLARLWPVLAASAFVGFVHVGGLIWLPTYIRDTGLFPDVFVGAVAGIMPLIGIVGMFLAGVLLRRLIDTLSTLNLLLAGTGTALVLSTLVSLPVQVFFVAVTMLMLGGVVAILLSSLPMTIAGEGRTSSAAGSITALTNVGGGLAGGVVGGVVEGTGWSAVFGLWAASTLAAMAMIWIAGRREPG